MTRVIEGGAFSGCKSLTSIVIPDGVTEIAELTFKNCSELKNITIPDSVTKINDYAFCGCVSITSIIIPASVTKMSNNVFRDCVNLTEITILGPVSKLDYRLFFNCTSLETVTLGASVKKIDQDSFSGCTALKTIYVPTKKTDYYKKRLPENLHSLIVELPADAFKDCTALKDKSFMEKMEYKFVKHSFDASWYDALAKCVENDGDTTKFDNDVVSVLKNTEEWHLLANEMSYDKAGIWVHNDDEYPFHFSVVKEGGEVVMDYISLNI